MKFIINVVTSIFIISQAFGQNYGLSGRVIADENDFLLPHTSVFLIQDNDTISTKTDYSGKYKFENLKKGIYKVYAKNNQRFLYDTIANISSSFNELDIRLKTFEPHHYEKITYYKFTYRSAPTSHSNYEYIILKDSLFLNQKKLVEYEENKTQERKAIYKSFSYALNESEQKTLDRLVKSNRLDLISTYEDRVMVWGWHWTINLEQQAVNFDIDLPNYHNQGLEEILKYVTSLVPEDEKFKWTR